MPVSFYFPLLNYKLDLVPGEVSVTAVAMARQTSRNVRLSHAHSSANGSQPRPWNTLCHSKPSVKNVLTLKSRLNTDMQYVGTFQNNPDRLPMCSKAPGAVITMSWHCVVIYTLKSNGILFISIIIRLNLRPLFLVLFDPWSSRRAASVLWLQGDCSDLGAGVVISCQMRLQSQGPTGNICQCPLHNTRFYGKIEPSSNCRGNSRASLLTDMSWKLASILEEIQDFFSLCLTTTF